MTFSERVCIEDLASDARKAVEKEGIISSEQLDLSIDKLKEIVKFFNGSLLEDNSQDSTYIIRNRNSFTIYYSQQSTYLDILHELGHAFFDIQEKAVGEKLECDGIGEIHERASLFARGFSMPRDIFETVVIRHSRKGKFNVLDIAKDYNTNYFTIMTRGKELKIFGDKN